MVLQFHSMNFTHGFSPSGQRLEGINSHVYKICIYKYLYTYRFNMAQHPMWYFWNQRMIFYIQENQTTLP